jgi:hypothetical protein
MGVEVLVGGENPAAAMVNMLLEVILEGTLELDL